ncbi:hypothetical protein BDZ91DRAFT_766055 [Kalaharituber pfeilii]|nr:hypothetical protein BDZ91DRAFT_766055 [Kalaharituber pfeilii]
MAEQLDPNVCNSDRMDSQLTDTALNGSQHAHGAKLEKKKRIKTPARHSRAVPARPKTDLDRMDLTYTNTTLEDSIHATEVRRQRMEKGTNMQDAPQPSTGLEQGGGVEREIAGTTTETAMKATQHRALRAP